MRLAPLFCASVLMLLSAAPLRSQTIDLAAARASGKWHTVNRTASVVDSGGRTMLQFDEVPGGGMFWNSDVDIADGDIDVDIQGHDVYQKSFVGVVFHAASDAVFDVVYVRQFNIRAADSTHHAHAIQYAAYPDASWEKLRADRPGAYEKALPASIDPNAWMHLKLSMRGTELKVFINGASEPAMSVRMLGKSHGGVGLWVGDYSPGRFANLRVTPMRTP